MAGFGSKVLLAFVLLLGTTSSAQAWWGWPQGNYPVYYGHAYTYYPVFPVCSTIAPAAPPQSLPLSKRMAAAILDNQSKEPLALGDMLKQGPTITETRSQSGAHVQAAAKDRCKVGFWNLTGRDVTLRIDGQPRLLLKDRAVTLDLDRAFVWQIDQNQSVSERVPEEQLFHEVIMRQ